VIPDPPPEPAWQYSATSGRNVSEADKLKALARNSEVSDPPAILRAFVRRYSGSRDEGLTSASRR
jgi:hypothetical protein